MEKLLTKNNSMAVPSVTFTFGLKSACIYFQLCLYITFAFDNQVLTYEGKFFNLVIPVGPSQCSCDQHEVLLIAI